jgi:hypothetical protein
MAVGVNGRIHAQEAVVKADRQLNIVSAEFKANPFPLLADLRASEPVFRIHLPDKSKTTVWLVTRYEDVFALLKDERFPKNRRSALTPEQVRRLPWVPPMFRPLERNMLDLDQPDHTRLRALVHKAFTPRLVEQMRERVQTLADELLDGVSRRSETDLINDYALPLPMTIITEILGVPTSDRHKFHKQIGINPVSTGTAADGTSTFRLTFTETDRADGQLVPFTFYNYRFWGGRKFNLNGSGGVGVNPNNGSAQVEFFFGGSLGFNNVFLQLGGHVGRWQELGGGLVIGDAVPAVIPVPIERRYTVRPSVGVSYKLPLP